MAMVLKISNGTTEVDFSTSNYDLHYSGWAPKRAQRTKGLMGGSRYADVVESISLQVRGTSPATALANLDTLSDLLEQSEVWLESPGSVSAVYIQYAPDGSSLGTAPKAVIKGPPPGRDYFDLPSTFELQLEQDRLGWTSDPITISFMRGGLWLGASDGIATSATSTGNPAIVTISSNFSDDADILMPYDSTIQFSASPSSSDDVYAAYTNSSDKLLIAEAESQTLSDFTSTVVTGSSAGSVARIDTGVTAANITDISLSGLNSNIRRLAVYMVCANNSSTINYTAQVVMATSWETISGITYGIGTTSYEQSPHVKFLGVSVLPQDASVYTAQVKVTSDTSVTSSNQLDIDYILIIGLDDSTSIVRCTDGVDRTHLYIEHQLDSDLSPRVYNDVSPSTTDVYLAYEGNAILSSTGNIVSCLVFGVGNTAGDWVITDSGNNELNATLSAERTMAYLTPV